MKLNLSSKTKTAKEISLKKVAETADGLLNLQMKDRRKLVLVMLKNLECLSWEIPLVSKTCEKCFKRVNKCNIFLKKTPP
jgi:hypothetical protein